MTAEPQQLAAAKRDAIRRSEANAPDADAAWERVLALAPGDPEAHYALGQRAGDRGDFAGAAMHLRAALARLPRHPQLRASLALALEESGALDEAEALWRALKSDAAAAPLAPAAQLARNLARQRRYADALALFDAAARRGELRHPLLVAAHAACLAQAGRVDAADAAFRRALGAATDVPGVHREYAAFLHRHKRYAEAAAVLDQSGAPIADDLLATSILLACRLQLADWHDYDALRTRIVDGVAAPRGRATDIVPAFDFVTICDDPVLQLAAARGWSSSEIAGVAPAPPRPRGAGTKLRLGFVSSDFGNHPVGRLAVALLERLDRDAFDVVACVTAEEPREAFRLRVERAVDRFVVLDRRDAAHSAGVLAALDIDVLFDLNGYSGGEAVRIFAHRPARLQVNFLGYTGTLAATPYDGIVCDAYCLPASREACYTESPIRIAPCYLPSDPSRVADDGPLTRATYGLPETGIVFCGFAAVAKIVPAMFDAWTRLLRDVTGSVLWLRHMPDDRAARLRAEAARRGIAGERLVIAPADSVPRYLARFALADLFLDSAPFGSHTTVNDALFSGLPVVTIAGESFAGRASASQLAALDLHALIARDVDDYVAIAQRLATAPTERADVAARLRDPNARAALFDMDAYTRRFEAAIRDAVARAARPGADDRPRDTR